MSKYFLSYQAKLDLKEIKDYIARNNSEAARKFVLGFREQCQILAKFPEMGRSYSEIADLLRGFPLGNYLIFYRPIKNGIQVERLLSGYRDIEALFTDENELN